MAILQAILSLISRSAGKLVNAIFGWAVRALFGQPKPSEQTLLSVLVAFAAAWPVLLLGIAFPRVIAMVVAFVPYSKHVPPWIFRLVWLSLSLVVPLVIGLVVASKAPPGTAKESFFKRCLRGFPITVGLASSFLVMFVTIPFIRLIAILRGARTEQIPVATHADIYHDVANQVFESLGRHQIDVIAMPPPWWMTVPSTILLKLGGKAFRGYVPERLEYFRGPDVEVALYPNALQLRGRPTKTGWAHGLIAETLTGTAALQTTDLQAQKLEQQIHRLWKSHEDVDVDGELDELTRQLASLEIGYDEWQTLYRELSQLARRVDGKPQLLDGHARALREPTAHSLASEARRLWHTVTGPSPTR